MSYSGELTDRTVADLLAALAESENSGKLTLSHPRGRGVVLFDKGLVGYAASDALRETFGSILVAEKHITERQLEQALSLQNTMGKKSLGSILVDLGVLSEGVMIDAVRLQVQRALADLIEWEGAHYEFEPMEVAAETYVNVPLARVLPPGSKRAVERSGELAEEVRRIESVPPPKEDPGGRQALLGRMANEIRTPEFTGEMLHTILGLASHVVGRAVLFLCRPDGFCGISQSGVEAPGGRLDEAVRRLIIPFAEPSILQEARETRGIVKRPLAEDGGDARLVRALGGSTPREGVAGPVTINERVMMILYGDTLPEDRPIGSILELNLLLIQAGMSVENNLLQKRVRHYESLRDSRTRALRASPPE